MVINWKPIKNLRERQLTEDALFIFYKSPSYFITGIVDCDCEVILQGQYFGYTCKELKEMFTYYCKLTYPEE